MRSLRPLLFAAALLLGGHAAAQPVFAPFTRADGLPSDYVLALYQDPVGYLWFGTDAGLARYDGQRVETFTTDDGLPHSMVYSIATDGAGTLYAGTFEGLARFDGRRFHWVETPLGRTSISELHRDAAGRLLVKGRYGLARREGDRWRVLRTDLTTQAVLPLPDGRVLVAPMGGPPGLIEADGPSGLRLRPLAGVPPGDGMGARLTPGDAGTFYLAQAGMLWHGRLVGERFVVLGRTGAASPRAFFVQGRDVYVSSGGPVPGIFRQGMDGAAAERVLALPADAFLRDYEGQLWIGTFGGGAVRLRAQHLRTLTVPPVVRLVRDTGGTVWASGTGLWRVSPRENVAVQHYPDADTRALALAPGGLVVSQNARGYAVRPPFQGRGLDGKLHVAFDASWIAGLDLDGDTLWAATYGNGVKRFVRGQVIDSLRAGHELPTAVVEDLVRTRTGLWLLTRTHGALRWRGRGVEAFGAAQGLPSSAVYSLYEQADGTRWFGTDRGVGRLRPGQARAATFGAGQLRGQRIVAFFERAATPGRVYAVGDRTLYSIAPDGQVQAFSAFALLPEVQASINAAVYDPPTDRLFLGTTRGLVAADLRTLPAGPLPSPRLAVQAVEVDDRRYSFAAALGVVRIPDLPPGRHRVEIAYALLAFAGDAHAEMRLAGERWRAVGDERRVVLPNLGAGTYRVELRAVRADGSVQARPVALHLRVRPFVWQRPWFWAAAALVLVALTVLAAWFVAHRRLRVRMRVLEAERRLRTVRERLSRDLHDHIGGQLATLISAADLAGLAAARGDTDRALAVTATLADEARQALGQLRQTVGALQHDAVAVTDLYRQVRAQAEAQLRFADRPALETRLEGVNPEGLEPVVEAAAALQVLRVAQEAVTNVLRHARAAHLRLTLCVEAGHLVLGVQDDGVGMHAAQTGEGAPGFGLSNMRARAEDVGGRLDVGAGDTGGTRVRLTVPLNAEA